MYDVTIIDIIKFVILGIPYLAAVIQKMYCSVLALQKYSKDQMSNTNIRHTHQLLQRIKM